MGEALMKWKNYGAWSCGLKHLLGAGVASDLDLEHLLNRYVLTYFEVSEDAYALLCGLIVIIRPSVTCHPWHRSP